MSGFQPNAFQNNANGNIKGFQVLGGIGPMVIGPYIIGAACAYQPGAQAATARIA